jgi:hypothetical protein
VKLLRAIYKSFLNGIEGLQTQSGIIVDILEAVQLVREFFGVNYLLMDPQNTKRVIGCIRCSGRAFRYFVVCRRIIQYSSSKGSRHTIRAARGT